MRIIGFLYGVICYAGFVASSLYSIGFVGNLFVSKSIDSGPAAPLAAAILGNTLLLGLFALQHSVMARPAFKTWWTSIVSPTLERSTYVLISSLLLGLLFWQWQAMDGVIWNVESSVGRSSLQALFWLGWLIALGSTFMTSHSDLFGLRQVWLHLRKRHYTPVPFRARALYKWVRHPIMLGYLLAFWATPHMTTGHLLFSLAMTAYILIGILFEERDLAALHGGAFEQYRKEVAMIIPVPGRRSK
ncbi:MAG: NnrU family protein [Candidatus Woesebacteria bacterium]|nr:NnrU family protein [Candidatus Woesebacteria bacterium]